MDEGKSEVMPKTVNDAGPEVGFVDIVENRQEISSRPFRV